MHRETLYVDYLFSISGQVTQNLVFHRSNPLWPGQFCFAIDSFTITTGGVSSRSSIVKVTAQKSLAPGGRLRLA